MFKYVLYIYIYIYIYNCIFTIHTHPQTDAHTNTKISVTFLGLFFNTGALSYLEEGDLMSKPCACSKIRATVGLKIMQPLHD